MIRKKTRLFLAATTLAAAGLVTTLGGSSSAAPGDPVFQGLTPARLLETRSGLSTIDGLANNVGQVGAGQVLSLTVTGRGGVPANAAAVALNVTVTEPSSSSYVTVYPAGQNRPTASNLNMTPNQTVANMVIVPVGANGQVNLFNFAGSTHLVADVLGWFPAGAVTGVNPARLLDTRPGNPTVDGQFAGVGAVGPDGTLNLPVLNRGGVPASGVAAVALNVTVTEPTAGSFVTAFPTGQTRPNASNLNMVPGQTVPNMVIVPVGAGGQVSLYNLAGNTHLIVDVLGWFPSGGGAITGVNPARLLETRSDLSTVDDRFNNIGKIPGGQSRSFDVVGRGGVPATGVAAVALNVTATGGSNGSYLTVYPTGATPPTASNVNFLAGQTVPNLVVVPVGANGQVTVFNFSGSTDVIVDVLAYFPDNGNVTPPSTTTSTTVAPVTAPVTRVSTRTGGTQGTVAPPPGLQPGDDTFDIPASTPAGGLSDPLFFFSEGPAISSNGRYVAFSTFQQLDAADTDDVADVYRKDLTTGTTVLISQTTAGGTGGTASATEPAISADGNLVVFQSSQTGLDGTDNNGTQYDVFIRNVTANTTTRLTNGNGPSTYPDISNDGRWVTFQSAASDIVAGDTNSAQDGFVIDRNNGNAVTRVTVNAAGAQATCTAPCNGPASGNFIGSFDMRISDDGTAIVFSSDSDSLVSGDNNDERDVFHVRLAAAPNNTWGSTQTRASIQRISVTSSETEVFGGTSDDAEPSGNGNLVVFHSRGNNLAAGDNENGFEVYVRDVVAGTTRVLPGGNGAGNHPMISGDGNWISFGSISANIVSGDSNGESDIFLVSSAAGAQPVRINVTATGAEDARCVPAPSGSDPFGLCGTLGGRSVESSIDATGNNIVFISLANNLVSGDTNGVADIFRYQRS